MLYSDGITEAENPAGQPFEESGLQAVVDTYTAFDARPSSASTILKAVERTRRRSRFADDLTILILKRHQSRRSR